MITSNQMCQNLKTIISSFIRINLTEFKKVLILYGALLSCKFNHPCRHWIKWNFMKIFHLCRFQLLESSQIYLYVLHQTYNHGHWNESSELNLIIKRHILYFIKTCPKANRQMIYENFIYTCKWSGAYKETKPKL
jgi:hypothetical protein